MVKNEISFKLKDKNIIKKVDAYCSVNNITYIEFATKVFEQFFSDERNKLLMLSKEQLIEVIMQWKEQADEQK